MVRHNGNTMTEHPEATGPSPARWWETFQHWPRFGRVTVYVAIGLVLLLVVGLVSGVVLVRRPFPQTTGELEVPGLSGSVEVIRDDHGIPQLYGDSVDDLMRAQGYVHAQERFFEMDVRRHATAGRLAELFGEPGLESDKYVRTMGWRRVAEQELALLQPETRAALDAYADGVNAYLDTHSPSQIAVEYTILGASGLNYRPEHWTAVDSLAWLKAMAWDLRGNMDDEIDRVMALADHTPAQVADLYPPYPFAEHAPIVGQGAVVDGVFEQDAAAPGTRLPQRPSYTAGERRVLGRVRAGLERLPALLGRGDGIGSNSWVVDGAHSTTGRPLLANDPHLGVSLPGVWMQMGLHCRTVSEDCPLDVAGFTFSGAPGVIIGHNADVAWGFTNLGPDVSDLYLERVDGDRWRYDGRWQRLVTRTETIRVRGGDDVTLTVRSTRHGPLLSDVDDDLRTVGQEAPTEHRVARGDGFGVALEWTALHPAPTADAILALDTASDWQSFRAAAEKFSVPAQNMVYADRAGHIGYQAPGRIPVRQSGNDGRLPAEGWRADDDWTGQYIPFDGLPHVLDPDEGFVVTANQAVVGPDYPYPLTDDWDRGYRSQRIRDVLEREGTLSVDAMARLQLDDRNPMAAHAGPRAARGRPAARLPLRRPAAAPALGLRPARRQRRRGLLQRRVEQPAAADVPGRAARVGLAGRRRPVVRGGVGAAGPPERLVVGRRHHRRRPRDPRRHPAAGDAGCPRRADPTRGARPRRLDLGPPAPAGPGEPDARHVRRRPGRVAGQPWRVGDRGQRLDRGRHVVGRRRGVRRHQRAVDADGGVAGRPRPLPVDQPHRRLGAPVRRPLHRPDRPVGGRRDAALGVHALRGRGGRRGHPHAGPRTGR